MILSGKGTCLGGGGFWVLPHHTVTLGKSDMISLSLRLVCGMWGWTLIFELISSSNVINSPRVQPHQYPPPLPHTAVLHVSSQHTCTRCSSAAGLSVPNSAGFRSYTQPLHRNQGLWWGRGRGRGWGSARAVPGEASSSPKRHCGKPVRQEGQES